MGSLSLASINFITRFILSNGPLALATAVYTYTIFCFCKKSINSWDLKQLPRSLYHTSGSAVILKIFIQGSIYFFCGISRIQFDVKKSMTTRIYFQLCAPSSLKVVVIDPCNKSMMISLNLRIYFVFNNNLFRAKFSDGKSGVIVPKINIFL